MSAATAGRGEASASPLAVRGGVKAAQRRWGWLFMAPALVAFACVILGPFVSALGLAFTRYDLQTPDPVFIGLANFRDDRGKP